MGKTSIDFFQKGKGFSYLTKVYGLNDDQIGMIRSKVYVFDRRDEDIEIVWPTGMVTNKMTVHQKQHFEIADDAVKTFFSVTGIKPDVFDLSTLRFHCVYLSPTIDEGKSIHEQGLLKLVELLEKPSPLSRFLKDRGIIIKPAEKSIEIYGVKRSIDQTDIAIKLYSTNSEIEAFIAGDIATLDDYSCIGSSPEILREISRFVYEDEHKLIQEWESLKQSLLYVSFDVAFDECAMIAGMARYNTLDNFKWISPFLSKQYEYGEEPANVWENYWFIDKCLENSCPDVILDRDYIALKPDMFIGPERIMISV